MALARGTRIGPYEISCAVGAGGMGEVYRARDVVLNRDVALKTLPDAVARDPDRLARFRREAHVLALLNHPNIAQIYGFEEASAPSAGSAGAVHALVMEFVEGPTLAERMRDPLGVDESVLIAKQIADALEAAHRQNIVHRDLKPSNVKLRPDGTVKLLDFGLAKVEESSVAFGSGDATLTSPAVTRFGVVLGTAAYMSPEQARGMPVDPRTDVWAFGAVLYEMLAGRRPFSGETTSDVVAAILERAPDWSRLPAATPPGIRRLLRRTLEKDPKRRLHDIADARIEIDDAIAGVDPQTMPPARPRRWWPVAAGVVVGALGLLGGYLTRFTVDEAPPQRFLPIAANEGAELAPAWSPDGRNLTYTALIDGIQQVFVRSLDGAVPWQITRAGSDCHSPVWSPDGTRILYIEQGNIWSIGVAGGQPHLVLKDAAIVAAQRTGPAMAFLRGFGGNRTLWTTSAPGAEPVQYRTAPFPETFTRSDSLDFSPDGSRLAVLVERIASGGLTFELWILPYPAGTPRVVAGAPQFSPAPFGTPRLSWAGNRHVVVQNELPDKPGSHLYLVDTDTGALRAVTGGAGDEWMPSVSPDGRRIAYVSGNQDFNLVQISLTGAVANPLLTTDRTERDPAWSPGGTRFAYVTNVHGGPELWLRSIHDEWPSPLLTRDMPDLPPWYGAERPAFSPDGRQVAYGVNVQAGGVIRHVIWISPVSGGRPVPLDLASWDHHGASWSPDGNWVAYHRFHENKWDLVKAPLVGGTVVRLGDGAAGGGPTAWSPAGDWVAAWTNEGLQLAASDGAIQRHVIRGAPPGFQFSRDGALLYALQRGNRSWELVTFDVRTTQQKSVVTLPVPVSSRMAGFSLHPDGKSFVTSVGTGRYDIWLLEELRP